MGGEMQPTIRDHQIFELLLYAHIEREVGTDLIEEYFLSESSLDHITRCAQLLLEESQDLEEQEAILKNLSECIVVKVQKNKESLKGFVRKILAKIGLELPSPDIRRAEVLIRQSLPVSAHELSENVSADE